MNRLADIIEDLAAADSAAHDLRRLVEAAPDDPIVLVNLDAVLRRRRDLEDRMVGLLSAEQNDLIRLEITTDNHADASAAAAAQSIVLFQRLLTAAFDAIVTAEPKRRYAPSPEAVAGSTLRFARAPSGSAAIHLMIPNDRLLAIDSDLDRALGLVLELMAVRSAAFIRDSVQQLGIATVSAAHAFLAHAAAHGLSTTIRWRKRAQERDRISVPHGEALAMATTIETITDDRVESIEERCELLAIDEAGGSFRLAIADGPVIAGDLAEGFPPGEAWTTRRWYRALLLRDSRVRYADGEETVRWSLRGLVAET